MISIPIIKRTDKRVIAKRKKSAYEHRHCEMANLPESAKSCSGIELGRFASQSNQQLPSRSQPKG
jgi:hypothetical protein